MNPRLTPAEVEACLEVLRRALVAIRLSGYAKDSDRAAAIADAVHNVPLMLAGNAPADWTIAGFRNLFLDALVQAHPDLEYLERPLDDVTGEGESGGR